MCGRNWRIQREPSEKNNIGTEACLCCLSECLGLTLFLSDICGQIGPVWPLLLLAGAAAALVWWLHCRKHTAANWFDLGLPVGMAVLINWRWEILYPQFTGIVQAFQGISTESLSAEAGTFREAAGYTIVFAAYLLGLLEFRMRCHAVLFVLNMLFFLLAASWRLTFSAPVTVLLLMFQFTGFAALEGGPKKNRTGFVSVGKKALVGVLFIVAVYAAASGLVLQHREEMYQGIYDLENSVYRTMNRLSQSAAKVSSDGSVGRGNNYQTGATVMEVRTDQLPDGILYLKGFIGSRFEDEEWKAVDETDLLEELKKQVDFGIWSDITDEMLDSMYYFMTQETQESTVRTAEINYTGGRTDVILEPYFCNKISMETDETDRYLYYEPEDIRVNWNHETYGENLSEFYEDLQHAYSGCAAAEYTNISGEEFGRLNELCEKNPFGSTDEVTAFIIQTLQDKTSYTLTPGRFPKDENIIECFLFERQKGYCVHYASTAVMMYRLYGIPARFASGYSVSRGEFVREEDGSYLAVVTDEMAHAWVEIYLDNYGWVPVEVTPSEYQAELVYPGLTRTRMKILAANSTYFYPASLFENERSSSGAAVGRENKKKILPAAGALAAAGMLGIGMLYVYRRRRGANMNSLEWYTELMNTIHTAGILRKYDGSEENFPELLSMELKVITEEEAGKLVRLITRKTFGPPYRNEQEESFAEEICRKGMKGTRYRVHGPVRLRLWMRHLFL